MIALLGFAQLVAGAPLNDVNTKIEEGLQTVAQGQQTRLVVDDREHIDTKVGLQRCLLVEIIDHHLGVGITLQLNDHPHPVAIALIANISNTLKALVVNQLSNFFNHCRLIGLIGQFSNNNCFTLNIGPPPPPHRLNANDPTHGNRTASGGVGIAHPLPPQNLAASRKIGRGNVAH